MWRSKHACIFWEIYFTKAMEDFFPSVHKFIETQGEWSCIERVLQTSAFLVQITLFYQASPPRFERKYGNIILTLTWIASLCIYFQTSKIQPSRVWIHLCKLCKWTQKLRDKVVWNKRDCRCENTLKPVALNIACWL